MATGASTADLAIILIDAERGVLPQTRRHSFIVSLLGISHVVVAINKMDLVGWSEEVFDPHPPRLPRLRRPARRLHFCRCGRSKATTWSPRRAGCRGSAGGRCSTTSRTSTSARPAPIAALPGPAGRPARPDLPRLRRPVASGVLRAGAPDRGPAVGPALEGDRDRDRRRRDRRGLPADGGDRAARRRARRQPRRRPGPPREPADIAPELRGRAGLDERASTRAQSALCRQALVRHDDRTTRRPAVDERHRPGDRRDLARARSSIAIANSAAPARSSSSSRRRTSRPAQA